jgi:hypothetical protein
MLHTDLPRSIPTIAMVMVTSLFSAFIR